MKFIPFENITYQSKLPAEEISKRLREAVEPTKMFRMTGIFGSSNHKPYQGTVDGYNFNISRIISYRNSFLPQIKGHIQPRFNRTLINVKMSLHPIIIAFMLVWFGGVGLFFLTFLGTSITKGVFDPTIIFPLGMLLFGYLLTTGGFKYESKKTKKHLADLLEAEIKEE